MNTIYPAPGGRERGGRQLIAKNEINALCRD